MNNQKLIDEFDRQAERLIQIEDFHALLAPLRESLTKLNQTVDGNIPFAIVVKSPVLPPEKVMPLVEIKGNRGEVRMTPLAPKDFAPIIDLNIPDSDAYLLTDINTGRNTLNMTPHNALETIHSENRFPLTIDEGAALVLQYPEVLTDKNKYNCFSVLGSRRNDQRVPAFWISYKKPRLGWCWDNNPHTWLGSASCGNRIGV